MKQQGEDLHLMSDVDKGGSTKDFDQINKETLNNGTKGKDEKKCEKMKKPLSSTIDYLMKHNVEKPNHKQKANKQLKEKNNGELEKEKLTDWKEKEQTCEGESEKGTKDGKFKERVINGTSDKTENDLNFIENNLNIENQKALGKKSEIEVPLKGTEADKEKYDTKDEAFLKTEIESKSNEDNMQYKETGENIALTEKLCVSDEKEKKKERKEMDERKKLKQNEINWDEKIELIETKDKGKKHTSIEKTQGKGKMNLVEGNERRVEVKVKGLTEKEGKKKSERINDQLIETIEKANEKSIKRKELDLDHRREKARLDKEKSKEEKHRKKEQMLDKMESKKLEGKIKINNTLTDKEQFGEKRVKEKSERGKIEVKMESMENNKVEEQLIIREKEGPDEENKNQIVQEEHIASKEKVKEKDPDLKEANTKNREREQAIDKREKLDWKEKIGKEYREMEASENKKMLNVVKEKNVRKEYLDESKIIEKERKIVNVQETNKEEGGDLAEKIQVKVRFEEQKFKRKEKVDVTNKEKPEDDKYKKKRKLTTESREDKELDKEKIRREKDKNIGKRKEVQEVREKNETIYENEKKGKGIWMETNVEDLIKQIEVNSGKMDKVEKKEPEGNERDKILEKNGNEAEMLNAEIEKDEKEMVEAIEKEGSKIQLENGTMFEEGKINKMRKNADEKMELEGEERGWKEKRNKEKLKEKEGKKHKKRKVNTEGVEVIDKAVKQEKNREIKRIKKATKDENTKSEMLHNKNKHDKMEEKSRKRQMKESNAEDSKKKHSKYKTEKEVVQNKKDSRKRKIKEEEEDAESKPKKSKNDKSIKESKKQLEEEKKWKWWEEENYEDGVKWKFLEHKGPYFAPPYEPLPDDVKFYYAGEPMKLSLAAEEVVTFYGKMLDHEYTTKEIFQKNFFHDWREVMTAEEHKKIKHLHKCDFSEIHKYFVDKNEARKALPKEEKQKLKQESEKIQEEFGYCSLDGHREKIGNFKTEPPGLFRGRGDHPKMGMLKKRIMPEDVIINCSKESKIPEPPAGHKWKEVRCDNTVTWLASWNENIQGSIKYIMLNPSSKLKGEKDWQKYEIARRLKDIVQKIRAQYRTDWKSREMKKRQRAVALYFIDKLALRAGNEKEEGESADTVGCCSLRVEHIKLHPSLDGQENVVEFDFLGKDSIRYYNKVPVEKEVFKNLRLFMENKDPGDELFDRLTTTSLNKHLQDLMDGLTAKVFRTYNASITLQQQLKELTNEDDNVAAKILSYNRANRAVALLCNHQRAPPKTFEKSMQNLQTKISSKEEQLTEAKKDLKKAKTTMKANKDEKSKKEVEKKKKLKERIEDQLMKLQVQATDKEENKQIALGTSKLNYLDPRITVAWCKKYGVPIEKIYNKTQRDKFAWAIAMADEDFEF